MKTIQLICIVFVVLLSSFPATIKSKKLADTCFESLAYCMNLIPRDKKYWEKDCCNVRAKRDQAATKQCSCIIANNPQKYLDLIKLFKACGLGNEPIADFHVAMRSAHSNESSYKNPKILPNDLTYVAYP
ncbi:hypothetical protein YC2023_056775 [Brassica napus]